MFVDLGAARVAEVEESGDFVEGFAGGVVDGFSEQLDVVEEVVDFEQGRVTTRDEKRDCLLYTSPSPRDYAASRMPSSA